MRSYRYLKNAERWVTVIGLFFFGTIFVSQSLWLTKTAVTICGLMMFVRLLLKRKMRLLYKRSSPKPTSGGSENDYEYVFTWALVSWSVFNISMMIVGFSISMDWMNVDDLAYTTGGLAIFLGVYTLVVLIRYYLDTKKEKLSGRQEVTAADFSNRATKRDAPSGKNKGGH